MLLVRGQLFCLVTALLMAFSSAFYSPVPATCRTQRCVLTMKRGRGSLQKEGFGGSSGDKPNKAGGGASSSTPGVRRDINWCPMPAGQSLPTENDQVTLLDTNLPTMKNTATNPTGAVAVVKASVADGQAYCFGSACPSCKIPLTKATLLEGTASTAPHPRLVCDFCKATYSLKNGARLSGDEAQKQGGGIFGGIVKNVFASQESGPLPIYKLGQKGKNLVIAVDQ
jgi:nitrite reductase/ring-hydroxylating ferredoxin subunit